MHGRCPTKGNTNVADLNIFVRENIHNYTAFIYGLQQKLELGADIIMALSSDFELQTLLALSTDLISSVNIEELILKVEYLINVEMNSVIDMSIGLHIKQLLSKDIRMSLDSTLTLENRMLLGTKDIQNSITIGTLNLGKSILSIENLYISDVQNLTLEELYKDVDEIYGFNLEVIKQ